MLLCTGVQCTYVHTCMHDISVDLLYLYMLCYAVDVEGEAKVNVLDVCTYVPCFRSNAEGRCEVSRGEVPFSKGTQKVSPHYPQPQLCSKRGRREEHLCTFWCHQ